MSIETSNRQTYKCPVCDGTMNCVAGGRKFFSYRCEICGASLMVEIRKPLYKVDLAGEEIYIDNENVAKLLNQGDRQ